MLRPRALAPLASLLAATLLPGAALALTQPNGATIPAGNGLQGLFNARGEAIDALAAASTTPETFVPSCGLTFEVLQRNAGYQNAFGWYNADGTTPGIADLHEFLACNDPVGTVKVLDIKNDPKWAGGEVGFYEMTGACGSKQSYDNVFFSEPAYNPDGNQQNPYIHLLIYNSTVTPKAFYFGWEDLLSGGDNDFDDLTTFVTGITCSGGGTPCDTGLEGVCAQGLTQCQNGTLACLPTIQPQSEACDGFDNDCNGSTDEGDLCALGEICTEGNCVPKCGTGEFVCPGDKVCNAAGVCVEPACATVDCPEGTKCKGGECVGPCDGVVCPFGQTCQLGVCLDPCAPLACDAEQVCVAGVCVDVCQCSGCPSGEACQSDGRCVPATCDGVTCPAGEHCDAATGGCVSNCEGAVCPAGQACDGGACVPDAGAGGGGGSSSGGFTSSTGAGGATSGAGGGGTSGVGGLDLGDEPVDATGPSCGCVVAGAPSRSAPIAFAWLAAAAAIVARAARRSRRA